MPAIAKIIRRYQPTFEGKHNAVKSKCWLTLYDNFLEHPGNDKGLTLVKLVEATGSNYSSLAVLLSRWVKWRYIGKGPHRARRYHLLKKGREWLDRWADVMPLSRYVSELEQWQLRDNWDWVCWPCPGGYLCFKRGGFTIEDFAELPTGGLVVKSLSEAMERRDGAGRR